MKNKYIFQSERLGFRRWQESDKDLFSAMNADPIVMKYFPKPLTKERSDWLIDKFEQDLAGKGYGIWAVDRLKDHQFIGFIGLADIDMPDVTSSSIEIAWRLDKQFWKKGYAVEGAKTCLDYAFQTLRMDEICAFTSTINKPSEKVMERIGMQRIKTFGHPKLEIDSPLKQHVLYQIRYDYSSISEHCAYNKSASARLETQ
ncbi:GNAT family N-acetyltransferase [Virgibacillus sp. Bac332]|uniref:GNAT family N-acetyltransferase n=1 Tax=Virgibacillus sp. Bac332 TaxID=2419842 RepID=UPI000EF4F34A|nr:GNAT family N-acetyltransferase [Virgibacillus sp. Bac332]